MQRLAELILTEISARVDTLSVDQAREVVTALHEKYTGGAGLSSGPPTPRTDYKSVPQSATPAEDGSRPHQLSEPASLSTELPLGAGADLEFTTLSSSPTLESSAALSEMSLSSRRKPTVVSTTSRQDEVSAIVATKPIVDDAKEVTAIATPEIFATHEAIVDQAKEVTAIKTPTIAANTPAIVDDTPDVREIEAATIVSTAKPIAEATAAPLSGISVPSARSGGLRAAHVVLPTINLDEVDDVIEAEVIFMDDE